MVDRKTQKDDYQKALTVFGQAVKEFHKGDLEKAAELFRTVIEKHASEPEVVDRARAYLAIAQKRQKKENVQLKTFEDYSLYGVIRLNQGEYDVAIKALEKALDFKTDDGRIYYLLADALMLKGDTDAALDALKKAIQKDKIYSTLAQNETDFQRVWDDKKFKLIIRIV